MRLTSPPKKSSTENPRLPGSCTWSAGVGSGRSPMGRPASRAGSSSDLCPVAAASGEGTRGRDARRHGLGRGSGWMAAGPSSTPPARGRSARRGDRHHGRRMGIDGPGRPRPGRRHTTGSGGPTGRTGGPTAPVAARPRPAAARRSACAGGSTRRARSRPISPGACGRRRLLPTRASSEGRRRHRQRGEPERLPELLVRHRDPRSAVVRAIVTSGSRHEPGERVGHGAERPGTGPALARPVGVGWLEEITVGHRTCTVAQHRSNRRRARDSGSQLQSAAQRNQSARRRITAPGVAFAAEARSV